METKFKNISLKTILIVIAVGIWAIVLQNAGVIPTNQNVKVVNAVDAYVRGSVDANVRGQVSVDNEVRVDISKINGWNAANYHAYTLQGQPYHSLGTR